MGEGAFMWLLPPQAPNMDAIKERIATIVARLEKAPERNGPKIRFMIFSAHRLMRNGIAGCVRYYGRELRGRESIGMVRKRQSR
jgi:hypothetical protein